MIRLFLLLFALGAASPAVAPAQSSPAAVEQVAPASGLPARQALPRTLRAYWHVFIAFAVAWILLFGYALSLGHRFVRLERDIQALGGGPIP
ncbi:MAG: CcmD family protein [Gemmatimonadota bacterium]|nr:CcmD family protein [Gemmatimonadota bacterium]